jgi:hypothetical protein
LSSVNSVGLNPSVEVVKTSKIVKVDSHCAQVWALVGDHPSPPDNVGYHAKRGVVLSINRQLLPLIELPGTSADGTAVRDFISADFARAESVGFSQTSIGIDIPDAQERSRVPLSLLRVYSGQSEIDGRRIYYFEARKEYRKRAFSSDAGCSNYSVSSGWVIQNQQGQLRLIHSLAYLTDCDGKENVTTIPLGTLILDGRTFIIAEELGYESESYVVLELTDSGMHRVLETYAGGC